MCFFLTQKRESLATLTSFLRLFEDLKCHFNPITVPRLLRTFYVLCFQSRSLSGTKIQQNFYRLHIFKLQAWATFLSKWHKIHLCELELSCTSLAALGQHMNIDQDILFCIFFFQWQWFWHLTNINDRRMKNVWRNSKRGAEEETLIVPWKQQKIITPSNLFWKSNLSQTIWWEWCYL